MNLDRFRVILHKEVRYIERDWSMLLTMFGFPFLIAPIFVIILGGFICPKMETIANIQERVLSKLRESPARAEARIAVLNAADDSVLVKNLRHNDKVVYVPSSSPMEDLDSGQCDAVFEMSLNGESAIKTNGTVMLKVYYDYAANVSLQGLNDVIQQYKFDMLRVSLGVPSTTNYSCLVHDEYQKVKSAPARRIERNIVENLMKRLVVAFGLFSVLMICMINNAFFATERTEGTRETLFSTPVRQAEIILAKWCAILAFTVVLVAAYAVVAAYGFQLLSMFNLPIFPLLNLSGVQVFLLVACYFQASMFIYALLLCFGSFSKSDGEMNALTSGVVFFLFIGLLPLFLTEEPSSAWLLVPIGNLAVGMREVLVDNFLPRQWYAAMFCNLLYVAGLLWMACRWSGREETMFGGLSELHLTFRRSKLVPRPRPSCEESAVYYGVALFLMLYVAAPLQVYDLARGLALSLTGVFLLFPLGLAWYLKLNIRETFRLRLPSLMTAMYSLLLLAGWLTAVPSFAWLQNRILPVPAVYIEAISKLLAGYSPVAIFGFGALLPAVCEETAFRGFMLSGLSSHWRSSRAIIVMALAFAIMHLDVYRFPSTFLLGVLLGILTVRSNSIFPAMVFHAMNNGYAFLIPSGIGDSNSLFQPVQLVAGLLTMTIALLRLFEVRLPWKRKVENLTLTSNK